MSARDCNETLLLMALDVAVPIRMHQIAGWSLDRILDPAQCQELADAIAGRGDVILYRSNTRGETAEAFTRLVEALAMLAYMPGGVEFAGHRYQAKHTNEALATIAKTWPGPISEADSRAASARRRGVT